MLLDNPNSAGTNNITDDLRSLSNLKREITGLRAIIITDVKDRGIRDQMTTLCDGDAERIFTVPRSGYMSALLSVIPLQRLAYDLTVRLGYDPDRPRNLAKELTTQ